MKTLNLNELNNFIVNNVKKCQNNIIDTTTKILIVL